MLYTPGRADLYLRGVYLRDYRVTRAKGSMQSGDSQTVVMSIDERA